MSKSRQEKTKTPAQSAPPPPVNNDVVTGRFTESDWNQMLDTEDGEDFVYDLVQEVVESTMTILHNKYIASQTLPYSVQEARQVLLDIVEWQFLSCDHGEKNPSNDPTWLEEEEPVAPMTDSWSQGSVPVVMPRPISMESSASSLRSETSSGDSCIEEERPDAPEPPFENNNLPVSDSPLTRQSPVQVQPGLKKEIAPQPPAKSKPAKTKKRTGLPKKHKGKLPVFSGIDLTSVTDVRIVDNDMTRMNTVPTLDQKGMALLSSSSSILKTQQGRPPGHKDVVYDEWGNVAAVIKLNPDKLPSYRVRTKFAVVDPASNDVNLRSNKHKNTSSTRNPGKGLDSKAYKNKSMVPGPVTPLPPPLVDSMDISAGVVVREGDVVRRGPIQVPRKIDKRASPGQLRPLDATTARGGIIEAVPRTSPVIRPLNGSDPIPPIQSPSQSA